MDRVLFYWRFENKIRVSFLYPLNADPPRSWGERVLRLFHSPRFHVAQFGVKVDAQQYDFFAAIHKRRAIQKWRRVAALPYLAQGDLFFFASGESPARRRGHFVTGVKTVMQITGRCDYPRRLV